MLPIMCHFITNVLELGDPILDFLNSYKDYFAWVVT